MEKLHERQRDAGQWTKFSDEHHTCPSCGFSFDGRFCPQCGMDATESRFSLRGVWNHFLAVFDFTDRSVPRTVRDLFWRPGYLINDYLDGRRRIYFPPIKLLIVVVLISAAAIKLITILGCTVHVETLGEKFGGLLKTGEGSIWDNTNERQMSILSGISKIFEWGEDNVAYSLMLQSLFWIVSLWLTLKMTSKKYIRKYNLAEVFMAEMYVLSQVQMASVVYMCLHAAFWPSSVVPASLPALLGVLLRIYDYWQLFRRGVWGTLWRLAMAYSIMFVAVVLMATFFIIFVLMYI